MKNFIILMSTCLIIASMSLTACNKDSDASKRASPSSDETWQTFTSPAGFYTVKYPTSWHVMTQDNIVNIMPEGESGAITVSAFHGEPPVDKFPTKWLRDSFENETPTSELKPFSRNGWSGVTQTFREPKDGRAWIAIVAQKGKVFVLITANDERDQMIKRHSTYERILESLVLSEK